VTARRVVVLADDLIWADRLAGLVRAAGAEVILAARPAAYGAVVADADRAIVDLTARGYDAIAAIAQAHDAGVPVLCVAQHDDIALRKRALAAGADRVLAYRAVAERGPAIVAAWLGSGRDLADLDDRP
jgi:DNA-binding response OmpR family regulator